MKMSRPALDTALGCMHSYRVADLKNEDKDHDIKHGRTKNP